MYIIVLKFEIIIITKYKNIRIEWATFTDEFYERNIWTQQRYDHPLLKMPSAMTKLSQFLKK